MKRFQLIVIFFTSEYFQECSSFSKENMAFTYLEYSVSQMNLLYTQKAFGDLEGVRLSYKDNISLNISIPTNQAATLWIMMNVIIASFPIESICINGNEGTAWHGSKVQNQISPKRS